MEWPCLNNDETNMFDFDLIDSPLSPRETHNYDDILGEFFLPHCSTSTDTTEESSVSLYEEARPWKSNEPHSARRSQKEHSRLPIVHNIVKYQSTGKSVLWFFMANLLCDPERRNVVSWTSVGREFRIVDRDALCALWAEHNGRTEVKFKSIIRLIRMYKNNVMRAVPDPGNKRRNLKDIYQFITEPSYHLNMTIQQLSDYITTHALPQSRMNREDTVDQSLMPPTFPKAQRDLTKYDTLTYSPESSHESECSLPPSVSSIATESPIIESVPVYSSPTDWQPPASSIEIESVPTTHSNWTTSLNATESMPYFSQTPNNFPDTLANCYIFPSTNQYLEFPSYSYPVYDPSIDLYVNKSVPPTNYVIPSPVHSFIEPTVNNSEPIYQYSNYVPFPFPFSTDDHSIPFDVENQPINFSYVSPHIP